MVAVGRGAGVGVLIKSAESLEWMEKVDTLVVDKTGTLTEGKPRVTSVIAAAGFSQDDVLRLAASLLSCTRATRKVTPPMLGMALPQRLRMGCAGVRRIRA